MKHSNTVKGFAAGSLITAAVSALAAHALAQQPGACDSPQLQQRLAAVDQRLREVEARSRRGDMGKRVTAPFRVVTEQGKAIFVVDNHTLTLFDEAEVAAVEISAESGGAVVEVSSTDGLTTSIGTTAERAGLVIEEAGALRLDAGRNPQYGNYRLVVQNAEGQPIAAIGEEANQHNGLALIYDAAGTLRAGMKVTDDDRGQVWVQNSNRQPIAALTQGRSGGGLLELLDPAGTLMVAAGSTEGGVGVVRTGPGSFASGVGMLGLPGSYIAGKAE